MMELVVPEPTYKESFKWVVAYQPRDTFGPCASIAQSLMGVVDMSAVRSGSSAILRTGSCRMGEPIRWAAGQDELRSCIEDAFPRSAND